MHLLRRNQESTQKAKRDDETRDAEAFALVERHLPRGIVSYLNVPLKDKLTSYLGLRNPVAEPVNPVKETVWLLDNTAYRPAHFYPHAPQPWQAEFVAAYFVKDTGEDISERVADIADKLGLGEEGPGRAEAEATIAQRLTLFARTIQPARFVHVAFPGGEVRKLGPGGRNAISSQILRIDGEFKDGETAAVSALPREIAPYGGMVTQFAEPEGWAVISDIDDSIKITLTPSPFGLLTSTFVSDPTPIAGMPALYARIATLITPTWFYLSASPYNLYPFLRPFLHAHYPPGTLILRDASLQNLSFSGFLLASLTQGTQEYKSSRVEKVHAWLPRRKVLCVGDSTQSDPEAYGDMYRRFGGGWIRKIFIRKAVGVAGVGEEKNARERFEKAFRGVPAEVWKVFEEPAELYEEVEGLKGL
ncbi:MAG: hypothetical protein Q9187_006658 [Circinaria calcarea]